MHIKCEHSSHSILPGWALLTISVNGDVMQRFMWGGSCVDAAYWADREAISMLRRNGWSSGTVETSSELVRMQRQGKWKARKFRTKVNLRRNNIRARGLAITYV